MPSEKKSRSYIHHIRGVRLKDAFKHCFLDIVSEP